MIVAICDKCGKKIEERFNEIRDVGKKYPESIASSGGSWVAHLCDGCHDLLKQWLNLK
jgi:hypothetical protein